MAETYELIVRGGTVVDGSGGEPFAADVAVKDGRIAAVGTGLGRAAEEIDAAGRLVTPGFVDIHTHYDAQACWDSHLAPSALHGVTTVVMGNCGVGFAPCRPADRQKLVELMEGVEDIPGAVMHEGLEWTWESFAGYLDTLERKARDVDVCALLPHAAVRVYVMGERALALEPATPDDIARMRAITAEAVRAGAFGVSTSRTTSHRSLRGEFIPTLRAYEDELQGLADGLADAGSGLLEVVTEWIQPNPAEEFAMLCRIAANSGRLVVYSLTQYHNQPGAYRDILDLNRQAARDGVPIRPVVAPRAIGVLLGLQASQTPFSGSPTFKTLAHLPLAARVARLRDPAIRAAILAEDPVAESTFPLIRLLSYDQMYRFGTPPNYVPQEADSVTAIAAQAGRPAAEVAYDLLLENEGRNFLYTPIRNYAGYGLDAAEELLADKLSIMGLGDGGAHVGYVLDAGYQTWLLTYWGKQRGRWPLPELIRRLTADTAAAAGLHDRGRIQVGLKGDLNVIDWQELDFEAPYMTHDLPAGGGRLMQGARGYRYTIVDGRVTYRDGQPTGALPGKLVRGMRPPGARCGRMPAASLKQRS